MVSYTLHPASFKDPSGFVFEAGGLFYRQVNIAYTAQYDKLMQSGLYTALTQQQQLLLHTEVNTNFTQSPGWYKTLQPQQLPFISYPYEWSFDQLRDAALLTLSILRTALKHGMILKDATPYNIQFHEGKPVFIDTLSFDLYDPSQPWVAYRQFCECFLYPLYLEHYLGTGIIPLLRNYLQGIPATVTAKLLPFKSRFRGGVWLHVLLQRMVGARKNNQRTATSFSQQKLLHLVTHLEGIIKGFPPGGARTTTWSDYYEAVSTDYLQHKENIFRDLCKDLTIRTALDLGANEGHFSKILAAQNIHVIATDFDSACINRLYGYVKQQRITHLLPLVLDIANPSPALGFNHSERAAFFQRVQPDLVVALALIHHLVISNNLPLPHIAQWLHNLAPQLIIEFIEKADPRVQQLLQHRIDVFDDYSLDHFEAAFTACFHIVKKVPVPDTHRTLYLLTRKGTA